GIVIVHAPGAGLSIVERYGPILSIVLPLWFSTKQTSYASRWPSPTWNSTPPLSDVVCGYIVITAPSIIDLYTSYLAAETTVESSPFLNLSVNIINFLFG